MDQLEQLYNLYLQNGLITSATSLDMFRSASQDQQNQLYELGKQKNLFQTTDLPTFQSAWSGIVPQPEELKKKEEPNDMASSSADSSLASATTPRYNKDAYESAIQSLTPDFIGLTEEQAAPLLSQKINESLGLDPQKNGFKFEETGIGDYIKVIAPNAQEIEISFDDPDADDQMKELEKLQNFIRLNKPSVAEVLPEGQESAEPLPGFVSEQLEFITPDKIGMTEENVAAEMNYRFGPLGFKFEETGMTGDYMIVTAPNGEEVEISLDNFKDSSNAEEAQKLKEFIDRNSKKISNLSVLEKEYNEENRRFATQEEVDIELKRINANSESFKNEVNSYLSQKALLDDEKKYLDSVQGKDKEDASYINRYNEYIKKNNELVQKQNELTDKQKYFEQDAAMLNSAVGKYVMMQSMQGTALSSTRNKFMEGLSLLAPSVVNFMTDIGSEFSNTDPSTWDGPKAQAVIEADKLGYNPPSVKIDTNNFGPYISVKEDTQKFNEWYSSLSQDQKDNIQSKIKDSLRKDVKYGTENQLGAFKAAQEGFKFYLGEASTTEEYTKRLEDESFTALALGGVAKSLPAMIGGGGVIGWTQRGVQMYGQATDAIYNEMAANPEFKDISENEKRIVAMPIGVAEASLEAIGLRNVIANKGLLNSAILSAIGKSSATTTAKTFGQLVANEVTSRSAKIGLTLAGAALAEGETGLTQQISEYAFKDIYNAAKKKGLIGDKAEENLFQTPEFLSKEYFTDLGKAAAAEALGGLVLGVPSAISVAYSKDGYQGMNDQLFRVFEASSKDNVIQNAFIADLRTKVSRGDISLKQAKETLNNYRNSVGLFNSVPDNLSLKQKKEAMDLLKEKKSLEEKSKNKDESLTLPIRKRIGEINTQLEKLSENAVQEQTTNESMLREGQSQVGLSQMASGNKIQVLTEEEEKRKGLLEQALSASSSPTITITDDSGTTEMSREDASDELASFNDQVFEFESEVVNELLDAASRTTENLTTSLTSAPTDAKTNITFMQEDGTETPVMGNEGMLANLYQTAVRVSPLERTEQQQSIVNAVDATAQVAATQAGAQPQTSDVNLTEVINLASQHGVSDETLSKMFAGRVAPDVLNQLMSKQETNPVTIQHSPAQAAAQGGRASILFQAARSGKFDKEALDAIRAIARRYNMNERGFSPKQVDENSMSRELAKFGLRAKRSKPSEFGSYGSTVYMVDETGRVFNPFKSRPLFQAASTPNVETIEIPRYFNFGELGGGRGRSGKAMSSVEADRNQEIAENFAKQLQEGDKLIEPNGTISYFKNGKVVKEDGSPYGMVDIPAFPNGVTIERSKSTTTAAPAAAPAPAPAAAPAPQAPATNAQQQKREEEIRKRGLDRLFPIDIDESTSEGKKLAKEKEAQEKAISQLDAELSTSSQPAPAPAPEVTPQEEAANERTATLASISAKNFKDLYRVSREIFGLNRIQALATTVVMDRMIGAMAKRANISKDTMMKRIRFDKTDEGAFMAIENVLFQGSVDGKPTVFLQTYEGLTMANGWYSTIEKQLRQTKAEKKSANQWLGIVGMGDEAVYTGVRAWLEEKNPQEQVSKQDILDFMKENRVEIVEIVGEESKGTLPKATSTQMRMRITDAQLDGDKSDYKEVLVVLPNNKGEQFRSTHFEEPNILVHLRMNTREDVDGNRVLFVEEVQSDWGQQGRKEGFGEETPTGPFVTDTNAWTELGLKYALRHAIEIGASKIAWTNGRQQIDRYGLEKNISRIEYSKTNKGEYELLILDDQGKTIVDEIVPEKALRSILGGQLAARVKNGENAVDISTVADPIERRRMEIDGVVSTGVIEDEGMKIGGQGMLDYYNNILPSVFQSLVKKLTGTKADLSTTEISVGNKQTSEQSSIEITPELKAAVGRGMPLFQSNQAAMQAMADGSFIVHALTNPNVSSPLHELAHVFEHYLTEEEVKTVIRAAKTTGWTRETSEYFARGFESYLSSGISPVPELQKIFGKFKQWLNDIYDGITGSEIDIKLNKKMKAIYDSMLENDERIENLPGYKRMMIELQGIVTKSLQRNVPKEKILENAIAYLQGSAVYQRANDIQGEQLVRKVHALFKQREKSAPSVAKILGTIKDIKKITMTEKALLAFQIRSLARGARDAMSANKKILKQIAEQLDDMQKKGKISLAQTATIINRFSQMNPFSDTSVESFVEYMSNVFADANHAQRMSIISRMLSIARKVQYTKLGIANELSSPLSRLLAINPYIIPTEVLDSYESLLKTLSEKARELSLQNQSQMALTVNEILDAVEEQNSKVTELTDILEAFDEKVFDDEGNLSFTETLAKMIESGLISEDDAKIMRKFKRKILNTLYPPVEETEAQKAEKARLAEQERQRTISLVAGMSADVTNLATTQERESARLLLKLAKNRMALNTLTQNELNNLINVINNIGNGFFTAYAQRLTEKLESAPDQTKLMNAVESAKPLAISTFYSRLASLFKKNSEKFYTLIERGPKYFIDQAFGNFKTKDIFDTVFNKMSSAVSSFQTQNKTISDLLNKSKTKVSKSFRNNPNSVLMSSYKMMAYMLQLEYESNEGNKEVNPAHEYLEATIEAIMDGNTKYSEKDARMLQSILDEYVDPYTKEIDINALYDSFNQAEKDAIKTIQEINTALTPLAIFVSSVIRGDKIRPITNYIHHHVLMAYDSNESENASAIALRYNNSMNPSTKAKSLLERSSGVKPLDFDVFSSVSRSSKYVLMDYYLTPAIRTVRTTLASTKETMKKQGKFKGQNRDIFNAIDKSFNDTVSDLLIKQIQDTTIIDNVLAEIAKQGYRAVLSSSGRFIAELTSNIGFAIYHPKDFAKGLAMMGKINSKKAIDFILNVKSSQSHRIYPTSTLSGSMIDDSIMSQSVGMQGSTANSDVANVIQTLYNNTAKKYKNSVETIADTLISTPDKIVMRPIWFGTFYNAFKEATGMEPDFDKIASNDEAYMNEYADEIEAATKLADERSIFVGASDNPFLGIGKNRMKANASGFKKAFVMMNSYMSRFMIYEYTVARTGIYAAIGNGSISKADGVKLLAAVTTRMTVYSILMKLLSGGLVGLLFGVDDEEEKKEKSMSQMLGQSFTSTATSLLFGRDFGNATRMLINYGTEKMNEKFLDDLRRGEYDYYEDNIQYSPFMTGNDLQDYIIALSGPYAPALKTFELAVEKATEKKKKEEGAKERAEDELKIRLPLEIFGHLGLIPLYKEIRKTVNDHIYKDLKKDKEDEEDDSDLTNFPTNINDLNKTDLKRYFPKEYERRYGKGTPDYYERQSKSEETKEEREAKDKFYKYKNPKDKSSRSSSRDKSSRSNNRSSSRD